MAEATVCASGTLCQCGLPSNVYMYMYIYINRAKTACFKLTKPDKIQVLYFLDYMECLNCPEIIAVPEASILTILLTVLFLQNFVHIIWSALWNCGRAIASSFEVV